MRGSLLIKSFCEALGTATITAMALASNNIANSLLSKSLLIGMTVTTLIHCFGRISGAHFNPAVSCYLFSKKLMSKFELTTYIFSQIFGSLIVVLGLGSSSISINEINIEKSININSTLLTEFIFTSFLLILISSWAREGKLCPISQPLTGIVIGAGISIFIVLADFFGSGILNPAISIGLSIKNGPILMIPQIFSQFAAVLFVRIVFYFVPEKFLEN